MDNVSREMEILRESQRKCQRLNKQTLTEMKSAFGGFICRLDRAEERISELQDMTVETSKTEKQREKRLKKKSEHPRIVGQLQKRVTYI